MKPIKLKLTLSQNKGQEPIQMYPGRFAANKVKEERKRDVAGKLTFLLVHRWETDLLGAAFNCAEDGKICQSVPVPCLIVNK